ncbi:DUF3099 domain-containing protein [Leucobacter sp. CSA2]|uniref:DUF3099 domain-containing protein n=1 Tax=Leucobacter edaphi TaxID=2796472 RepID=A0A934QDQ5_9MICO|nr:DUF3099 domain-containing protein [Leucobacter edaphi]MBK0421362.1 DUF3099 domain-containing protein [Leucobacter edaphi]
MAKSYRVTSAGVNPTEDRAHRMRMYFIAMTLRMLCVVSLFWLHGWWVLLSAAGAVFLPWFAVMIGNAVAYGGEQAPDAPEPLQLESSETAARSGDAEAAERPDSAADTLIVMDAEPVRRSARAEGADSADLADPAGPSERAHGVARAAGPVRSEGDDAA